MLNLFEKFFSDERLIIEMKREPIFYATASALHNYVKQGHKLSDLPWFRSVNFGTLENNINDTIKKAA